MHLVYKQSIIPPYCLFQLLLLLSVISIALGAAETQLDAEGAAVVTFQKLHDLRLDQYDEDNDETLTFNEWKSVQSSRMKLQPGTGTHSFLMVSVKVSFFHQCSKVQLIPFKKLNI